MGAFQYWQASEDELLIQLIKDGLTYGEIKPRLPNRSLGAIQTRACGLREQGLLKGHAKRINATRISKETKRNRLLTCKILEEHGAFLRYVRLATGESVGSQVRRALENHIKSEKANEAYANCNHYQES